MDHETQMTDEQIKHMVNRFLGWRLPEHFRPDAGISFNPEYNVEFNAKYGKPPARHQPTGTNLFDATQAEAMVRYMLDSPASGRICPMCQCDEYQHAIGCAAVRFGRVVDGLGSPPSGSIPKDIDDFPGAEDFGVIDSPASERS